jgi:integrase
VDTKSRPTRSSVQPSTRVQKRFTATNLSVLPVGTYTDPATIGLQFRVTSRATGQTTRSWLLRFKFKGTESRLLLGHFPLLGLADARQTAQALRECAAQGIDPRRAKSRRAAHRPNPLGPTDTHTVGALAADFLERHVRPHRKRPEYAENILKRDVLPIWGDRDARTIEPREVIALLDGIVDRGSPIQANRVHGIISQLFRYGIHRQIVADTPVKLLYRPGGKEKPRQRVLSDDELRVIVRAPQQALRFERTGYIAMALLLTGQRRGDLTSAVWKDVNFKERLWRIPPENAKNNREHLVPLSEFAIEQFYGLKRLAGRSAYVVPNSQGDAPIDPKLVTRSIARCLPRLKRLGVAAFTLHDLRRTCRTGLARLGIRPDIAERVLNHSVGRLIQVYDVYTYLDERRNALDKWASHLQSNLTIER